MKLFTLNLFIAFFILTSCTETQPEEAKVFDQKMTETIAIHDEVMPEMSRITNLIQTLESQVDSTNANLYKPVILDLKTGHDKMMEWMKDFGDDFSKTEINDGIKLNNVDSLKSRLEVLENSKKQAEDMKNHIQEAIKKAERILKQEK